jgi:prepilin-type processing-associated H-X9-DG protein
MKPTVKPTSLRPAFTLVEILVTITIIITLAGVVFTMASRAKQSATSASTLNNLREIGVCAGLWMSENNNFFPPAWDNNGGANRSYAQVLDPYMHGVTTYRSAKSKFIGPDKRLPVKVNNYSHPITYTMNRAVCRDITTYGNITDTLVHVTKVSQPTQVILLADGCQNPSNLNQTNATAYRLDSAIGRTGPAGKGMVPIPVGPDVDTSKGDGWFRYPWGKCHVLFCDGSAKAFTKGSILNKNIWIDGAQ